MTILNLMILHTVQKVAHFEIKVLNGAQRSMRGSFHLMTLFERLLIKESSSHCATLCKPPVEKSSNLLLSCFTMYGKLHAKGVLQERCLSLFYKLCLL